MNVIIITALLAFCCGATQAVIPVANPYGVPHSVGLPYGAFNSPYPYSRPLGVSYAVPPNVAAAPILGPAVAKVSAAHVDDYDPNPQYSYAYDIKDALTGDSKSQQETRSGDVVQGSYSVVEPDGSRRIVEYVADAHSGFNAVVHKEPAGHVVKAVAAAPLGHYGPAYLH